MVERGPRRRRARSHGARSTRALVGDRRARHAVPGVALAVLVADCAPVVLVDPGRGALGRGPRRSAGRGARRARGRRRGPAAEAGSEPGRPAGRRRALHRARRLRDRRRPPWPRSSGLRRRASSCPPPAVGPGSTCGRRSSIASSRRGHARRTASRWRGATTDSAPDELFSDRAARPCGRFALVAALRSSARGVPVACSAPPATRPMTTSPPRRPLPLPAARGRRRDRVAPVPLRPRRPGVRGADHARPAGGLDRSRRCSRRPGSSTCSPASRTTRPARRPWSTSARCPVRPGERGVPPHLLRGGLGEFAYRNGLDLADRGGRRRPRRAPAPVARRDAGRPLVPFGGGIDSIVTVDEVRAHGGAERRPRPVRREPGRRSLRGDRGRRPPSPGSRCCGPSGRSIPRSCARPSSGSSTATCPVTGILSAIAVLVAVADGRDAVVMSNEWSASSGNVRVGDRVGQPPVVEERWRSRPAFRGVLAEAARRGDPSTSRCCARGASSPSPSGSPHLERLPRHVPQLQPRVPPRPRPAPRPLVRALRQVLLHRPDPRPVPAGGRAAPPCSGAPSRSSRPTSCRRSGRCSASATT